MPLGLTIGGRSGNRQPLDRRKPLLPPIVNPKHFEPEFALVIGFALAAPKEQTPPSRPCGA
eukprot:6155590-Pyramimonas_sp.AAC.1